MVLNISPKDGGIYRFQRKFNNNVDRHESRRKYEKIWEELRRLTLRSLVILLIITWILKYSLQKKG